MTQCWEEIEQIVGTRVMSAGEAGMRFNADDNSWEAAKAVIGDRRVTLGRQASQQWLDAPDHLAMVLSRYRVAAALIGDARSVLEAGAGEGIGARILSKNRQRYCGVDFDADAVKIARETVGTPDLVSFAELDLTTVEWLPGTRYDAVVSLDVAEHIPPEQESAFFTNLCRTLTPYGRLVVGTPSAYMHHLASPQSRAGHVNLFTPERLQQRLERHFHATQMLFMQDVALHAGHPAAAHYILAVGIGPR